MSGFVSLAAKRVLITSGTCGVGPATVALLRDPGALVLSSAHIPRAFFHANAARKIEIERCDKDDIADRQAGERRPWP